MAKSPAFQFYPADFMTGAPALMSCEETHVYVRLLCLDWVRDGFTFDAAALARACSVSPAVFKRAWRTVQTCFIERDGKLTNPRLEREREKQAEWRAKSAAGGRAGAKARWGDDQSVTNGSPPLSPPPIPTASPNDDSSVFSLQSSDSSASSLPRGRAMLLDALPLTRAKAMRAALDQYAQGYGLPPGVGVPTPEQLDEACRDVLASASPETVSPRMVRGFLVRLLSPDVAPQRANGAPKRSMHDQTYDNALAAALAIQAIVKEAS